MPKCNRCGAMVERGYSDCPDCGAKMGALSKKKRQDKVERDISTDDTASWSSSSTDSWSSGTASQSSQTSTDSWDSAYGSQNQNTTTAEPEPEPEREDKKAEYAWEGNDTNHNWQRSPASGGEYGAPTIGRRILALVSYWGVFVVIPIIAGRNDKFVRSHINQGIVLLAANIIISRLTDFGFMINIINLVGAVTALLGMRANLPGISKIDIIK